MRSKLLLLAALANAASATYVLQDDYQPENFLDMVDFFDAPDPTYGYVHYLDRTAAHDHGLISTDNGTVYMGVDSKEIASGRGRKSVRIETKKTYEGGLIAIDVQHMPGGICGVWPAFWSVGPNWPQDGEVDIIEGINSRDYNLMALHTMDGCVIEKSDNYKAVMETDNCYIKAPNQGDNQGCAFNDHSPNTFGKGFNEIGGGVYATEWKQDVINIWFFPRGEIPEDLNANPDPTKWGKPNAQFKGTCDFGKLLKQQRFIFNTAICGGWTVSQWASDPVCSSKAPTCEEFVKNNPEAFEEAFWEINYMKVFQEGLPEPEPSPKPEPKPTPKPEPEPEKPEPEKPKPEKPEPEKPEPEPEKPEPTVEEPKPTSEPEPTKIAPSPAPEPEPTDDKPVPNPPSEEEPAPSGSCTNKPVTPSCTTYVTTITETIVRTIPIDEANPTPAARRHIRNHLGRRHH